MQKLLHEIVTIGTVLGVLGGIISSVKLFGFDKLLNRRQRAALIVISKAGSRTIRISSKGSSFGYEFEGLPKQDIFARFVLDISDVNQEKYKSKNDVSFSSETLIFIDDLVQRGHLKKEIFGNTKNYMATRKGLRWGRFYHFIGNRRFGSMFIYRAGLLRKHPIGKP